MFTDLNKHAVKTSNSISELYDGRDALAVMTRRVIESVSFLNSYVDKEHDHLGIYSKHLFTLNHFYKANKRIVGKKHSYQAEEFLTRYWELVSKNMMPWIEMEKGSLCKTDLRSQYVASQAIIIQIFGKVGVYYYQGTEDDMESSLMKLQLIDWKRSNHQWKRITQLGGRMVNCEKTICLAANLIKQTVGDRIEL